MVKATKLYNSLIWFVSVFVPLVVALLLFTKWSQDKLIFDMKFPNSEPVVILDNLPFIEPLTFLPPIYALINGLTAIFLVVAVYYIKNGKRKIHESLIKVCIALSLVFLVMYIAYHMTTDPTSYGGKGFIAYVYYFILITHIILSVAVIPLVLTSYNRAVQSNFQLHKKIAKITFPIWLYVAVTGVVVYIMISPYY